jgi:hypothetical protein
MVKYRCRITTGRFVGWWRCGGGDGGGVGGKVVNTMNDKEKERKTKIRENE